MHPISYPTYLWYTENPRALLNSNQKHFLAAAWNGPACVCAELATSAAQENSPLLSRPGAWLWCGVMHHVQMKHPPCPAPTKAKAPWARSKDSSGHRLPIPALKKGAALRED